MEEQLLINYTKNENTYLLAIRGKIVKVVSQEDETSAEFVDKLKELIQEYYG